MGGCLILPRLPAACSGLRQPRNIPAAAAMPDLNESGSRRDRCSARRLSDIRKDLRTRPQHGYTASDTRKPAPAVAGPRHHAVDRVVRGGRRHGGAVPVAAVAGGGGARCRAGAAADGGLGGRDLPAPFRIRANISPGKRRAGARSCGAPAARWRSRRSRTTCNSRWRWRARCRTRNGRRSSPCCARRPRRAAPRPITRSMNRTNHGTAAISTRRRWCRGPKPTGPCARPPNSAIPFPPRCWRSCSTAAAP